MNPPRPANKVSNIMDTLTFPDPEIRYPLSIELDGDRLFGTCVAIADLFEEVQRERECPGFEIFFTGTSGAVFGTALAAVNRAKPAPMDMAFCQVAKNTDAGAHHRAALEGTHNAEETEDFCRVFVDDFIATGETFRRTMHRIDTASHKFYEVVSEFDEFDGLVVLSGGVKDNIEDRVDFVIRPEMQDG